MVPGESSWAGDWALDLGRVGLPLLELFLPPLVAGVGLAAASALGAFAGDLLGLLLTEVLRFLLFSLDGEVEGVLFLRLGGDVRDLPWEEGIW